MVLKVCDSRGSCLSSDVRAGDQYAVSHGAKSSTSAWCAATASDTAAFDALITDAANQGVVVVTAAGNSSTDATAVVPATPPTPSLFPLPMMVSSAHFLQYRPEGRRQRAGLWLQRRSEISAILSVNSAARAQAAPSAACTPVGDGRYCHMKGTSMATPMSAGSRPWPSRQPFRDTSRCAKPFETVRETAGMGAQDKACNTDTAAHQRRDWEGASQAPGLKITSPASSLPANHTIQFRLEARSGEVTPGRCAPSPTAAPREFLRGVVGSGGTVLAGNSASLRPGPGGLDLLLWWRLWPVAASTATAQPHALRRLAPAWRCCRSSRLHAAHRSAPWSPVASPPCQAGKYRQSTLGDPRQNKITSRRRDFPQSRRRRSPATRRLMPPRGWATTTTKLSGKRPSLGQRFAFFALSAAYDSVLMGPREYDVTVLKMSDSHPSIIPPPQPARTAIQ